MATAFGERRSFTGSMACGLSRFGIVARKRLFLSRDRFGKKPLFWFQRGDTFAFASELTALLEHERCPRNVSRKALQKFFAYALIPAPHSLIEGVWKLPAGHNLIVESGEQPVIKRYWRFEIEPDTSLLRAPSRGRWRRNCLTGSIAPSRGG